MRTRTTKVVSTAVILSCSAGLAHGQDAAIHELLPPPGVTVSYMYAWDVSSDGEWAVGYYTTEGVPSLDVAVRWPLVGPNAFVAQPLPVPNWSLPRAHQVSGDGSVILGTGRFTGASIREVFRWTAGGVTRVTAAGTASVSELSANGVLAVFDSSGGGGGAVINTVANAIVRGMPGNFYAMDMSNDGSVVVGVTDSFPNQSARSVAGGGGLEQLCGLIGCGTSNDFTRPDSGAVSGDGSTWAGVIRQVGEGYGGYDASLFLYRNGQLVTVPNQCGIQSEPSVAAVSLNGGIVVGTMYFCESSSRAFYYSDSGGMQRLDGILSGAGVDLSAWLSLENLRSVSADGRVVVGGGMRSDSVFERPFVAFVPVPCDSIDFNRDSLVPDVQDIGDFLSVFSGGVCAGQQPGETPCNGDIDFNNDTLLPDAADIASLLRVFSGGSC